MSNMLLVVSICAQLKELLIHIVVFTALLIEHSFSRHLYNSMEVSLRHCLPHVSTCLTTVLSVTQHLTTLLSSSDMQIVLAVLNLLYVFSKRSNFISRLNSDRRQALIQRLSYLAEVRARLRFLFASHCVLLFVLIAFHGQLVSTCNATLYLSP